MATTALFRRSQPSTDPALVCQEYRWTINRLVLRLSSSVLAQQCRKSEETIDLSHYDPSTIRALLDFCRNTQHYAPTEWFYEENDSPAMEMPAAVFHVRIFTNVENRFLPRTDFRCLQILRCCEEFLHLKRP
ncbi:hypothetical protein AC578_10204 [Pseudocercospora eumusae]|uniref:Uncharacterized protein n=1 Tax=Pseudocercospora eumusae TaxID=321146 RepID=A0A139HYV2_9PEZI|nr:hypothetical protein AC578_10204 [Pseudocercospora eumusae]